jgi:WD40 repeat protein
MTEAFRYSLVWWILEKRLTSQGIIPMPLTLLGKAGTRRKKKLATDCRSGSDYRAPSQGEARMTSLSPDLNASLANLSTFKPDVFISHAREDTTFVRHFYNVETFQRTEILASKDRPIVAFALSSDKKTLATVDARNHAIVWDQAARTSFELELVHFDPVTHLALSPDDLNCTTEIRDRPKDSSLAAVIEATFNLP